MPMGSGRFGLLSDSPKTELTLSTKNPLYLKIPRSDRFITTETMSAAFLIEGLS